MTAYSWCGSFTLPTVDEPDPKGNDKLGRRRKESVIEPKTGADASGRLLAAGGEPTLQGRHVPILAEQPSLNPPLTKDNETQRGVRFNMPYRMCESCGRKTGWIVTYGRFNSHRTCVKCMGEVERRLVENIHRVNDGKEPLPMGIPRREDS
jgi:hypothetical protein